MHKRGKPIEPGCLAMVVNCESVPENNGKVVTVLRLAETSYVPSVLIPYGVRPRWDRRQPAWVVQGDRLVASASNGRGECIEVRCTEAAFYQSRLVRLDDGDAPEQEHEHVSNDQPQPTNVN